MRKLLKISIAVLLGLSFLSVSTFADIKKGQKIYIKKFKKACNMSGWDFAKKHTQDEWEEIIKEGKFKDEIHSICKDLDISKIKDSYLLDFGDFVVEYASDSDNIPSC